MVKILELILKKKYELIETVSRKKLYFTFNSEKIILVKIKEFT